MPFNLHLKQMNCDRVEGGERDEGDWETLATLTAFTLKHVPFYSFVVFVTLYIFLKPKLILSVCVIICINNCVATHYIQKYSARSMKTSSSKSRFEIENSMLFTLLSSSHSIPFHLHSSPLFFKTRSFDSTHAEP